MQEEVEVMDLFCAAACFLVAYFGLHWLWQSHQPIDAEYSEVGEGGIGEGIDVCV